VARSKPAKTASPSSQAEKTRYLALVRALLTWYAAHRRDLPWRRTKDPYAVWISETMLQQTRVETVVPYYERFLRELPTLKHLAEAPSEQVLALWSGLGYYRRARMLHAAARQAAAVHGALPSEVEALRELAGIGAYTAGAVASIAFSRPAALVDGNVARVLARLFAIEADVKSTRGAAVIWALAETLVALVPGEGDPGDWNQALMELGATVCVPREPRCDRCPVRAGCEADARGIASTLPRTRPKKEPVPVRKVAIVLASDDRVLLARRRGELLFGGMWEPPMGDDVPSLASRLAIDPDALEPAGAVVHVLSHRRMLIDVARAGLQRWARRKTWALPGPDYDAVETVAFADLGKRPHASLALKVLAVAEAAPPL
jgi:A/G-specific adenine glycosylase